MRLMARLVVVMLMVGMGSVARAQDALPDAHIRFSSTSYGFLVGYSQGQGTLELRGRPYPFSVTGIKVATLGVARVNALGQVYRLRELADFPGRYYTVEGAFTLGQGGGNTLLRNEKGVTLYLQNVQQGVELTLGGGGIDIVLAEPVASPSPGAAKRASTP